MITFEEFGRTKLRVGQILAAERVAKSEKLLKLSVDLGVALGKRQIVAGIAKHYAPESLIGRKVAVVANLKPAKLMGLESQGMLLAGSDESGNLELVSVGDALPAGSEVR
jgi:methionyl-tRNA synthetase